MIVRAAVRIYDNKQQKEITIPCHRHCDAFYLLHEFGYSTKDYKQIAQGFLDEHDNFYTRVEAWKHAWEHNQLKSDYKPTELFSEDLW